MDIEIKSGLEKLESTSMENLLLLEMNERVNNYLKDLNDGEEFSEVDIKIMKMNLRNNFKFWYRSQNLIQNINKKLDFLLETY